MFRKKYGDLHSNLRLKSEWKFIENVSIMGPVRKQECNSKKIRESSYNSECLIARIPTYLRKYFENQYIDRASLA